MEDAYAALTEGKWKMDSNSTNVQTPNANITAVRQAEILTV